MSDRFKAIQKTATAPTVQEAHPVTPPVRTEAAKSLEKFMQRGKRPKMRETERSLLAKYNKIQIEVAGSSADYYERK
jgi:hypothetical protein